MAKVYLQLVTKNHTLDGDRIEIDSETIPRVGEIVDAWEYLGRPKDKQTDYIVLSVIHKHGERFHRLH